MLSKSSEYHWNKLLVDNETIISLLCLQRKLFNEVRGSVDNL